MAATTRAVQITRAGGDFEMVERSVPDPGVGQVRVRVEACGMCHSDFYIKEGLFPGITYPRVPGHEVIGRIEALGRGVVGWKEGDRVGIGWHGGHCHHCLPCRKGDFVHCTTERITGVTHDGGYADYLVSLQEALARVPDDLDSVEAAPLCCAGITVFNGLRNTGVQAGATVAVVGVGGLGHLAIQYAARQGFHTVAISHGSDKQNLARELGAHHYIDSSADNPAQALQALGGADVILATAPNSASMTAVIDGLARRGQLVVMGVDMAPIQVSPLQLLTGGKTIKGWPSGTPADLEDTLNFSALNAVRPMIETFPLERAGEAYQRMMANEMRFRAVLKMS